MCRNPGHKVKCFVTPQEAGHATRDGTRAPVNVSITAFTLVSMLRKRRHRIFQPLTPAAEGWHADCIPARAGEPPTTMGGRNEHHTRNDSPQFQACKPRCAGKQTDRTVIEIRRLLAACQRQHWETTCYCRSSQQIQVGFQLLLASFWASSSSHTGRKRYSAGSEGRD